MICFVSLFFVLFLPFTYPVLKIFPNVKFLIGKKYSSRQAFTEKRPVALSYLNVFPKIQKHVEISPQPSQSNCIIASKHQKLTELPNFVNPNRNV